MVRPVPISEPAPASQSIATDDDRLRILRSLERGEIDVAEAGRRLGALEAGEPEFDGGVPRA